VRLLDDDNGGVYEFTTGNGKAASDMIFMLTPAKCSGIKVSRIVTGW